MSRLLHHHREHLAASAIHPEVIEQRGYCSATEESELADLGFGSTQLHVPALVMPTFSVAGESRPPLARPDEPRFKDGKAVKYEIPVGTRMFLDVPHRTRPLLGDPTVPLLITEGIKKADAAVSHGLYAVTLTGVWNFRGTNSHGGKTVIEELGAYEWIDLKGRTVRVAFDSDVMVKPEVHQAMVRLSGVLRERGARIEYIYLPHRDGGAKRGLDDAFADGFTRDDILGCATSELRPDPVAIWSDDRPDEPDGDDEPGPDFAAVLDDVRAYIRRFVRITDAQEIALTLWVAHTHAFAASRRTPYIIITSPREECGKSLLLEVLALLVARAWSMEGPPSEAALFRKIEQDEPTVLFDESEAIFSRSDRFEGMRSVILGGNRRGATVPRCFGAHRDQVRDFRIYAPKAFAAIKASAWPRTQLSRSIVIKMQRLRPDEGVEDFYSDVEEGGEAQVLHDKLAAWAQDATDELKRMRPERLTGLGPRAFEGWVPLLNVADLAGGEWPEVARRCATDLTSASASAGMGSDLDLDLLTDIREVFAREGVDRVWSSTLVGYLNGLEESGWGAWNDGAGMKQKELSNKLAPYEVHPKKIRIGSKSKRGYMREQFQDAFSRYIPSENHDLSGTPGTTAFQSQKLGVEHPEQGADVPDGEGAANPHSNAVDPDVPDKPTDEQGERGSGGLFDDIDPDPMAPPPRAEQTDFFGGGAPT